MLNFLTTNKKVLDQKKNILIVSHGFPPNPGIAGRRWAKFAKYLQKEGYQVYVIASENISTKESNWLNDIKNTRIEYLPFHYPKWIYQPGNNITNKLLYKLTIPILKLIDKGNYYDRSIFWKNQIQKKISDYIIKKNIDTVIVSSGPFRLSHYVAQMKLKFPNTKFIVDYRDLWTEDIEITSFSNLPKKRKLIEKKWEKETVYLADNIITVANKMSSYFDSLTIKNKTITIPNGYDEEDFNQLKLSKDINNNNKIKFVFTGTLYRNLSYILIPFFRALAQLKKEDNALYSKIEINFLGLFPPEYRKIIDENQINECINIFEKVPLHTVYAKINEADFCLLFLNNVYNFSLSTKFCEYISQKKKIVVMANKGNSVDFITENKLGYWINPEKTLESIKQILMIYQKKEHLIWNSNFDIHEFSVQHLTKKVIDCIENRNYAKTNNQLIEKHILFTFDYELFLGKESGTVDNCMIKPTNLLLNKLNKHNIKHVLFFVDTSYLIFLQKQKDAACLEDFEKIKLQLIKILKDGHYIFPHIHPHWIDAKYNKERKIWQLSNLEKYRFHNISEEEQYHLFEKSIEIIKSIQIEANIEYDINSYRAGGWCLQPFEDFKPFFKKFGIKNDFSVLRNYKNDSNIIYYDFTEIPLKYIYSFSDEINKPEKKGDFNEFSISNIEHGKKNIIVNKFLLKYLHTIRNINFGDGFSVKTDSTVVIEDLKDDLSSSSSSSSSSKRSSSMASIELLTSLNKKYYVKHVAENDYLHMISHPKMLSKHNINQFDKLIEELKRNYTLITDYKKMIY